jgi:rhamnosyltransferase
MSDARPSVSIAIPVQNGMRFLPQLFAVLRAQKNVRPIEVVAADDNSSDGSGAYLAEHADQVLRIAVGKFHHATTRNLLLSHCRGECLVLLVQDALPVDEHWLAHLIAPLRDDPAVAGVFARQLPRPEASVLSRRNLATWVAARDVARRVAITPSEYEDLTPNARLDACAFDHVCACVRRSVWQTIPIPDCPIAEDLAWAKQLLFAGHAIAYAPAAVVWHSHDRGAWYELQRTWALHQQLRELFGLRLIPDGLALFSAWLRNVVRHTGWVWTDSRLRPMARVREMCRAEGLALAWPLGQYLGGNCWPRPRFRV